MRLTKDGIKNEWEEYYITLEEIRESGATNMLGAAPYLAEACDISEELAEAVLANWITNYTELSNKYRWR